MGELTRVNKYDLDAAITILTGNEQLPITPREVMQWIAPGAPQNEAVKFLLTARALNLNPFLKQVHLVPMGTQWVVIVDKSGWLKKAEEHPQYDGYEAGIIAREVTQTQTASRPRQLGPCMDLEGAFLPANHIVVGGWAKVYRKDRSRPTTARVSTTEYSKSSPNWSAIPCTMIRKVALVQALRESGVTEYVPAYDDGEFPGEIESEIVMHGPHIELANGQDQPAPATQKPVEYHHDPQVSKSTLDILADLIDKLDLDGHAVEKILARRKVRYMEDLTELQAGEIIYKLQEAYDKATMGQQMAEMVAAAPAPAVTLDDTMPAPVEPQLTAAEMATEKLPLNVDEPSVILVPQETTDIPDSNQDTVEAAPEVSATTETTDDISIPDQPRRRGRKPNMVGA